MKLLEAIKFATLKHDGQRRKLVDEPYILHPLRVTSLVELFVSEPLIDFAMIVAVLHDTLEDTATTYKELSDIFGDVVAKAVFGLTNPPKAIDERRKEYKIRIHEKLAGESNIVKTIKMCDRLDNLRSMKTGGKRWRDKYCDETRDLLRNIGDAHSELANIILVEVEELEALKV